MNINTGSTDGKVHVWSTDSGIKVATLQGDHTGPVQCVQFNPKFMMLASACTNMASYSFIIRLFNIHMMFITS